MPPTAAPLLYRELVRIAIKFYHEKQKLYFCIFMVKIFRYG